MSDRCVPQLRILATSYCENRCIYCRPSGEASMASKDKEIDLDTAIYVSELYKKFGGTEIKITGGEPVFWSHLIPFVKELKKDIGIDKIELITRSPEISQYSIDLWFRCVEL